MLLLGRVGDDEKDVSSVFQSCAEQSSATLLFRIGHALFLPSQYRFHAIQEQNHQPDGELFSHRPDHHRLTRCRLSRGFERRQHVVDNCAPDHRQRLCCWFSLLELCRSWDLLPSSLSPRPQMGEESRQGTSGLSPTRSARRHEGTTRHLIPLIYMYISSTVLRKSK